MTYSEVDELADPSVSDGLHLTSEGYRVVFEQFQSLVLTTWPELNPETMVMPTPQ